MKMRYSFLRPGQEHLRPPPLRREFRRWFSRAFFADFELGASNRFSVIVDRVPQTPEQRGATTVIDACASYY